MRQLDEDGVIRVGVGQQLPQLGFDLACLLLASCLPVEQGQLGLVSRPEKHGLEVDCLHLFLPGGLEDPNGIPQVALLFPELAEMSPGSDPKVSLDPPGPLCRGQVPSGGTFVEPTVTRAAPWPLRLAAL